MTLTFYLRPQIKWGHLLVLPISLQSLMTVGSSIFLLKVIMTLTFGLVTTILRCSHIIVMTNLNAKFEDGRSKHLIYQ